MAVLDGEPLGVRHRRAGGEDDLGPPADGVRAGREPHRLAVEGRAVAVAASPLVERVRHRRRTPLRGRLPRHRRAGARLRCRHAVAPGRRNRRVRPAARVRHRFERTTRVQVQTEAAVTVPRPVTVVARGRVDASRRPDEGGAEGGAERRRCRPRATVSPAAAIGAARAAATTGAITEGPPPRPGRVPRARRGRAATATRRSRGAGRRTRGRPTTAGRRAAASRRSRGPRPAGRAGR